MKVKELIEELKKMPQDADVEIQASGEDAECWGYDTIYGSVNMEVGINDYDGSVYIRADELDYDDMYEDD